MGSSLKYDTLQALGVGLVVLGGRGAVRQLVDHDSVGLLSRLPGRFAVGVGVYVVAVLVGAVVAGRAAGG
ncbi:hypothetical protein [Streptomyces spectabilis]|uniref:hypothetical protein n=1 Tax=Streptomyces spectabilis TaxID=68270 RepID=UPI001E3781AA|nr:hypothetical protein [Streptomyces spectabilis]MCI3900055.1 hypothetical protein [Streptomyces spectabilis]